MSHNKMCMCGTLLRQGDVSQLPYFMVRSWFNYPDSMVIGIVCDEEPANNYTVVAVGKDVRKKVNAIQISQGNSWRTVCLLPEFYKVSHGSANIILWNGKLFCRMHEPEDSFMVYDLQNKNKNKKTSSSGRFPRQSEENHNLQFGCMPVGSPANRDGLRT
ncbi:hypothetical protein KI387_002658, partial [Taxus chinensis]